MDKELLTITGTVQEGRVVEINVNYVEQAVPALYWVFRRMAKQDNAMGRALRSLTEDEYPEEFIKFKKDFALISIVDFEKSLISIVDCEKS